ncbi:hypothetical protein HOY82DRAFT_554918 [Tuber indicum]|nr:hypothetical protein HOY82DRAFT_554918 [Tuber indicum]
MFGFFLLVTCIVIYLPSYGRATSSSPQLTLVKLFTFSTWLEAWPNGFSSPKTYASASQYFNGKLLWVDLFKPFAFSMKLDHVVQHHKTYT